jgi:hypothetical protein
MHTLARKLRQRRDTLAFERALRTASPTMQQELFVAAQRHNSNLRLS